MKKQFLAILLVMCLVIGSCPVWAVASNDDFVIENGVLLKYTGTSKNVTIPSGITSIGDRAFRECHFLFRIVFPDTLKRIGNRAFEKCDSLVSVSIPNTVISIGDDAFSDCDSLRACLKIEEMTNFYPEGVHFKEKTAKQSSDWRGFLTQKGALSG